MMITLNKPIAVVCRMNRLGNINPFKFRLKEAGGEARTCYISAVNEVTYGRHMGEEVITYHCTTQIESDEVACNILYMIGDSTWVLYQMHSTIGIAI